MTRTVYLVVYNSRLFPAHWNLWIPSLNSSSIRKRLHAEGDAANRFEVVFERNYALDATSRQHQCLPLAEIADHHVIDVDGDGSPSSDSIAHDNFEQVLLGVPAPDASLVSNISQVRAQLFSSQNSLLTSITTRTKKTCADPKLSNVATSCSSSTSAERNHGSIGFASHR